MNEILMIKSRIVVDAIKPSFVSVQEVLRLYEGHMAQEHRTQHGNLVELLKTEFISVIYELSSSSTAMIAAPIFINCLMDSNYDYNELKAIHDMRDKAILDDVPITIQTVAFIDAALKNHVKMQQPLSQVILTLFEKIGKGYLRILNEDPNELFNAWINAHQQFVAAVKADASEEHQKNKSGSSQHFADVDKVDDFRSRQITIEADGETDTWDVVMTDRAYLLDRRKELGLTQQQVADRAGIKLIQYQRFERGERSMCSASFRIGMAICDVLKLDPHRFTGYTD